MALLQIPAKALIFICVIFLALVVVQLRWVPDDEQPPPGQEAPQASRMQISQGGRLVDVETEALMAPTMSQELVEAGLGFLATGSTNVRRTAAIELAYMTNDPAEQEKLQSLSAGLKSRLRDALLKGLRDPDATVARSCAEALIGWWRTASSPAVNRNFQEGLAAFEAGQMDVALKIFDNTEALGGSPPLDLYRMRAEALLAQSLPQQALAQCRRALALEPRHFAALYAEAKAYAELGQDRKALEALDEALSIYAGFASAQQLRAELYHAA